MAPPAWLTGWRYAHRGLHDGVRLENTAPAFAAAIEAGLGIECDVQASGDGVAMVFHDWTLDRMTGAGGDLRARTAAELGTIRCRCGTPIASLEHVLAMIAGRAPVLVEVKSRKDADWRPLAASVGEALAGYAGPAAVMSFDARIVRWFADASPGRPRGLVSGRAAARRAGLRPSRAFRLARTVAIRAARPDFLACDVCDLPDPGIVALRRRGMPVLTWTVRSAADRATAAAHADTIIAEGGWLGGAAAP